jgi:hypothetical protein
MADGDFDYDAEKAKYADRPSAPRFPLYAWSDLTVLPKRRSLVKRLLDRSAMSVWYGASNSAKTFVAIDLAIHIARGTAWRERKVTKGAVVYCAVEGGLGIEERFTAWRIYNGINPDGIPLFVIPAPLDMCHSTVDVEEIASGIEARLGGDPVVLVVVDTVSRAMAGGNENAPDDMGLLVANADRLRQRLAAHVALIHHTGKDTDRGARGHSLLRAAADTEIEITRDDGGIVSATVTKQRDHRSGDCFKWKLETVEIGADDDGDAITSCVLLPVDSDAEPAQKQKKLTGAARLGLEKLNDCIVASGVAAPPSNHIPQGVRGVTCNQWRAYLEKGGVINPDGNPREQFRRIRVTLLDAGFIGVWDDFVWPVTSRHDVSQ